MGTELTCDLLINLIFILCRLWVHVDAKSAFEQTELLFVQLNVYITLK